MTAPKIDTQAPERIWATGGNEVIVERRWWSKEGAAKGVEYVRADVAAAREAAAWIAGQDAAATQVDPPSETEAIWSYTQQVLKAYAGFIRALTPPADPSAALDRLIAERVREAVEAEREACAKIADSLSTQWWSDCKRIFDHHTEGKSDGADDIANAIRARSSKDGRDG